jgi:hypothetical protein
LAVLTLAVEIKAAHFLFAGAVQVSACDAPGATEEVMMAVELVLEVNSRAGAQTVVHALDAYKATLRAAVQRSRRNLRQFEDRYGVTTMVFLQEMAAEDLSGGDVEYVEWAGEAKLLEGIEAELKELEDVRYRVP